MQAVGRLGSYISRSVYNVSGTFHPFGGCVDIIVVEQPDGSFKSSPWYVRFGKFQGVLKSKEKAVTITVNGVDADFHMYLDNRGEAYFLNEVDVEEGEPFSSPPTSSGEEMDIQPKNDSRLKSRSCNYDSSLSNSIGTDKNSLDGNGTVRYKRLGLIFGRKRSMERNRGEEKSLEPYRADSLERAEIAADLLDLKWSTNLASSPSKKDNAPRFCSVDINKVEFSDSLNKGSSNHSEADSISNASYLRGETTVEEAIVEVKCLNSNCGDDSAMPVDSNSRELSSDEVSLVKLECRELFVSKILEVENSHFQVEGYDEKLVLFKNCSDKDEDTKDNIHYSGEASKTPEIGLDGVVEQSNCSFRHAENDNVDVTAGIFLNMTDEKSFKNYETEGDLMNAHEQLNSEVLSDKGVEVSEEKDCMSEGSVDDASERLVTEHYSQELVPFHQPNDSFKETASDNFTTFLSFNEKTILSETVEDLSPSLPSSVRCDSAIYEIIPHVNQEARIFEQEQSLPSCISDCFGSNYVIESELKHRDYEGKEVDDECIIMNQSVTDEWINDVNQERRSSTSISNDICINNIDQVGSHDHTETIRSLPDEGLSALGSGITSTDNDHSLSCSTVTKDYNILDHKEVEDPLNSSIENCQDDVSSFRGGAKRSFSLSFKRSRSKNISQVEITSCGNNNCMEIRNELGIPESQENRTKPDIRKRLVQTIIPTSEQLASLKLEQGKNLVTFTFSTAMLGKQQVDARIFLWRWDTRIVISDVDGTITRSDLLGQVMPLVGMDWSQSGVAHLFSAIKENGYQLLFLSARSIAQSFHTRQFLFNIKQDGKALPEGPVVISPDGLFPSLYREVIRRAPHEFKISCLEDIKALFPGDMNPFYAGFGNRDTDEFSYVKVGIPKGKIFIINPKGEIVVNRRVDTKSYSSLHSLVHGMFPMSSCEQEDFNSWNFWKLPPPLID